MKFPAGKYYIGDPCYAIADDLWSDYCDEIGKIGYSDEEANDNGGRSFEFQGEMIWHADTFYGDGEYKDEDGLEYGVDAGMIGVTPYSLITPGPGDQATGPDIKIDGGHIIEFAHPFETSYEDGVFYIGHIRINTKDEDPHADEWDDDEWDDEEDEEEDEDDY